MPEECKYRDNGDTGCAVLILIAIFFLLWIGMTEEEIKQEIKKIGEQQQTVKEEKKE